MNEARQTAKEEGTHTETAFNGKSTGGKAEGSDVLESRRGRDSLWKGCGQHLPKREGDEEAAAPQGLTLQEKRPGGRRELSELEEVRKVSVCSRGSAAVQRLTGGTEGSGHRQPRTETRTREGMS